jgi:hypothetical protein
MPYNFIFVGISFVLTKREPSRLHEQRIRTELFSSVYQQLPCNVSIRDLAAFPFIQSSRLNARTSIRCKDVSTLAFYM